MAAGKPIIGAIDGETARVIAEADCGYCGKAENARALVENIIAFVNCDQKIRMGNNARKYYGEMFEKRLFMDKLLDSMEAIM